MTTWRSPLLPVTANPLVGELDVATGHGTYIAGIVRQVVPEATVLSIRIMHSDDVVYEGDLVAALRQLALRVQQAQDPENPRPDLMVDVVSLSLGYFCESPPDVAYTSTLKAAIDDLRSSTTAQIGQITEIAIAPEQEGTAFIADRAEAWREILCIIEERIVSNDNTIAWAGRRLQLPESRLRPHFVKATVRVHEDLPRLGLSSGRRGPPGQLA